MIEARSTPAKSKRWQRERIVIGIFVGFGGAKDELHMLGRLFQRLQQGIERLLGEHVHFVDDVDLERARLGRMFTFCRSWRISSMPRLLAPSISNASTSSPADTRQMSHSLHGVGVGPCTQLSALARIRAVEVFPVPRAGKQKRVPHAAGCDRGLERPCHVLLPDHFLKRLGAIATRNHNVFVGPHGRLAGRFATESSGGKRSAMQHYR